MKSQLFENNPTPTEELANDLKRIAALKDLPAICIRLPAVASRFAQAPNRRGEAEALEELRDAFSLAANEVNALLRVSVFVLREMAETDTAEDIANDLRTLRLVDEDEIARLGGLLKGLVVEWKQTYGDIRNVYATQQAVVPTPVGVSTVVDLRAVIPGGFKIGDDLHTYKPRVATLVPVAITNIRFDDGESVVFQMDVRTLRILVDELQAAEKEMVETMSFVGHDKVHPGRRSEE